MITGTSMFLYKFGKTGSLIRRSCLLVATDKWKESITQICYNSTISLSKIKEEFSSYPGGQVDLSQDEKTGIATICLNNPDRRNAFSGRMMVQLSDIVDHLEKWKTGKALILHSNGSVFCSGGDLSTVKNISNSDGGMRMSRLMHDTLFRLSMLPLISVAVVQGKALGGGAELTLACDFRLFTTNASIQFVHIKMGTVTGWSGGTRLVHLLGLSNALKLIMLCQPLIAEKAVEIKLADDILSEKGDAVEQAKKWLEPYLHGDTEIIQAVKTILAQAACFNFEKSLENERKVFSSVWGGPANIKALQQNLKHR